MSQSTKVTERPFVNVFVLDAQGVAYQTTQSVNVPLALSDLTGKLGSIGVMNQRMNTLHVRVLINGIIHHGPTCRTDGFAPIPPLSNRVWGVFEEDLPPPPVTIVIQVFEDHALPISDLSSLEPRRAINAEPSEVIKIVAVKNRD